MKTAPAKEKRIKKNTYLHPIPIINTIRLFLAFPDEEEEAITLSENPTNLHTVHASLMFTRHKKH